MRPDTITLAIEEKFTPEQKCELANQLAAAVSDLDGIYSDKKVSDAAFNEQMKSKEAEVSEFAKKYNKGCELRHYDCNIRYDMPSIGKKSFYRKDTEELVETRDMTIEEKQETLQFPLPAPEKKKSKNPDVPAEPEVKPVEITFRYFQDVAATIVVLPKTEQATETKDMSEKLADQILKQGKLTDHRGKVKTIKTIAEARKLADSWLSACVLKQQRDEPDAKSQSAGAN